MLSRTFFETESMETEVHGGEYLNIQNISDQNLQKKQKQWIPNPYEVCNLCGEYLPKLQDFNYHMLNYHSQVTFSYNKCTGCGKFFKIEKGRDKFSYHCDTCIDVKQIKKEIVHKCKKCGKLFSNKSNKVKHEKKDVCVIKKEI